MEEVVINGNVARIGKMKMHTELSQNDCGVEI
jgi:hypothetical protein